MTLNSSILQSNILKIINYTTEIDLSTNIFAAGYWAEAIDNYFTGTVYGTYFTATTSIARDNQDPQAPADPYGQQIIADVLKVTALKNNLILSIPNTASAAANQWINAFLIYLGSFIFTPLTYLGNVTTSSIIDAIVPGQLIATVNLRTEFGITTKSATDKAIGISNIIHTFFSSATTTIVHAGVGSPALLQPIH